MNPTIIEWVQGAMMMPDKAEMTFMATIAGIYAWTCWKAMTGK